MIPRPTRDNVFLRRETPEQARARISGSLILVEHNDLQGDYPEAAFRAEVLAVGPACCTVNPGDVVLVKSYRNIADSLYKFPGDEEVLILQEDQLLGVIE